VAQTLAWGLLFFSTQRHIVAEMLERVIVKPGAIELRLNMAGIARVVLGLITFPQRETHPSVVECVATAASRRNAAERSGFQGEMALRDLLKAKPQVILK